MHLRVLSYCATPVVMLLLLLLHLAAVGHGFVVVPRSSLRTSCPSTVLHIKGTGWDNDDYLNALSKGSNTSNERLEQANESYYRMATYGKPPEQETIEAEHKDTKDITVLDSITTNTKSEETMEQEQPPPSQKELFGSQEPPNSATIASYSQQQQQQQQQQTPPPYYPPPNPYAAYGQQQHQPPTGYPAYYPPPPASYPPNPYGQQPPAGYPPNPYVQQQPYYPPPPAGYPPHPYGDQQQQQQHLPSAYPPPPNFPQQQHPPPPPPPSNLYAQSYPPPPPTQPMAPQQPQPQPTTTTSDPHHDKNINDDDILLNGATELPDHDVEGAVLTEDMKLKAKASHTAQEEASGGGAKFRALMARAQQKVGPIASNTNTIVPPPPPTMAHTMAHIPPNAMDLSVEEQARLFREITLQQQHQYQQWMHQQPQPDTNIAYAQHQLPQYPYHQTAPPQYLPPGIGYDGRKIGRNRDADVVQTTADVYFAKLKQDSTSRNVARINGDTTAANAVFHDPAIAEITQPAANPHLVEQRQQERELLETVPEEMLLFQDYGNKSDKPRSYRGISYKEQLALKKKKRRPEGGERTE